MRGIKHTLLLFVLFFCLSSVASDNKPRHRHKRSGNGVRLSFGPSLNTYRLNERHGSVPKQKLNGTIGLRRELRVSRDYTTYLLFGLDYMLHGMSYQSYYFKPDSVKLYDKKFNYTYSLFINEVHIPVQMKYLLRREDNAPFSPYILVGYHFRTLLPGNVKVHREGRLIRDDEPGMKFKNYLISDKINSSVSASIGWQINNMSDNRGSFFGEINFLYGFSDYYFEKDYSATAMYINCTHVTLLLGFKF